MPLLAVLDEAAFNALPDETVIGKNSYLKNEKTNAYQLALDGAEASKLATPLQDEVAKLKANNQKLLDEKIKAGEKADPFIKLGKTPEELAEMIASGKTDGIEELEKKHSKEIESLKTSHEQAIASAKTELETAKTATTEVEKQLMGTMIRTRIEALKTDFGFNKLADDFFAARIKIVKDEATGSYVEQVFENGELAYKGGALKTPAQLAEETRANKEYAGMITGGTGQGTGAPGQGGGMSYQGGVIQISAEASKSNPQLYQQAKAQAEKEGKQIAFTD